MRYFNWFLRIVLFIALFGLAVKNDQPITLRYFFNYEWQSTLVVLLLIFFACGTVIGVLAMFSDSLRLRREIAVLKREIRNKNKQAGAGDAHQPPE